MRRAVAVAVSLVLTLALACTAGGGRGDEPVARVFVAVDDSIGVGAPINPYSDPTNSVIGYNGMQLAWPKNVAVDDPTAFYPGVAKSWDVADDQSTVTVRIQPRAAWSDGSPVTADDLEVSAAVALTQGAADGLTDVRVTDDGAVEFVRDPGAASSTFARTVLGLDVVPAKVFGPKLPDDFWATVRTATSLLAPPKKRQVARERIAALGDELVAFGPERDVSCGPFVLQHVGKRGAVLVRNEHFWAADRIRVDRVLLRTYPSDRQLWRALSAQRLDAAPAQAIPATAARRILAKKNNKRYNAFRPLAVSLAFDQRAEPFDRLEVRRGLAHAIDTEQVARVAAWGSGFAAQETSGLVATVRQARVPDAQVPRYRPDREAAAKAFEAAGLTRERGAWRLPDGTRWSFTIAVPAGFPDWLAAARSISGQLKAVGVDAGVETVGDYADYVDGLAAGRYTAGIWQMAYGPSAADAYQRLYRPGVWMHLPKRVDGVDPGQLAAELTMLQVDEQRETVARLARFTGEQLPVLQLWDARNVAYVNTTRFRGFPQNDSDVLGLSPGVWMQLGYIRPAP